ncbi:MAG: XRE family transcriptional regulator [Streptococcus lutetiensis]|nr:XRE family transcriptional regulator [Streptococcus lutetiensis]MDU7908458.1 XRE family transcriptional regulator [Streptococcus lutetiensis]
MARGRGKLTPQDIEYMKIISSNINRLLNEQNKKQVDIARGTKIPPSTITGYVKGTSLPIPGNVEKIADFFGVLKSDIDPRFKATKKTISSKINFDPRQAILLSNYNKLNDNRKDKLIQVSEKLLAEEEGKVIDICEKRAEYETRKRVSLPAPGKVSAGTGYWQEDDYDTMVDFYEDEIPDESEYDTIAIVVGHSMEPKIKNGDFLFIKLKNQVDLNKIGIFKVDGENYVKKLKSDRLESLNKEYDDIQLSEENDIRTIGEVVDIYREC